MLKFQIYLCKKNVIVCQKEIRSIFSLFEQLGLVLWLHCLEIILLNFLSFLACLFFSTLLLCTLCIFHLTLSLLKTRVSCLTLRISKNSSMMLNVCQEINRGLNKKQVLMIVMITQTEFLFVLHKDSNGFVVVVALLF